MARTVSSRARVAPSHRARRVTAFAFAFALARVASLAGVARARVESTTDRAADADDSRGDRSLRVAESRFERSAVEVSEAPTETIERDVTLSSVRTSSDGKEVSFSIVDYAGAAGALEFELAHAEAMWKPPEVVRIEANGERTVLEREEVETALGCMYEGEVTETGTGRRWAARAMLCDGDATVSTFVHDAPVEFIADLRGSVMSTNGRGRGLAARLTPRSLLEGTTMRTKRTTRLPKGRSLARVEAPYRVDNSTSARARRDGRRLAVTNNPNGRYVETAVYVGKEYMALYSHSSSSVIARLGLIWAEWQAIFDTTTSMDPPGYVIAKQVVYPASNADNAWGAKPSTIGDWLDAVAEDVEPLLSSTPQYDTTVVINDYGMYGSTIGLAWVGTVCTTYSNNRYRYSVNTGGESSLAYWSQLIGHEVGHNLGFNHDSSKPGCEDSGIMGAYINTDGNARYSEGTGCDAEIWNTGTYRSGGILRSVDYDCLSHTNTEFTDALSNTPTTTPPPSPPPAPPHPPGYVAPPPPQITVLPSPPPPLGTDGGNPVTDGTTKYVQTVIGVGGVTVSFFTTATRSAFLLAVIEYLNLEGRPGSVSLVSIAESSRRRRRLLQSSSVDVTIKVNAATDTEETALVTALAPAKGPQLTSALQTELPQINSATPQSTTTYVVLEEAPDSDLDRLRQYGALIIGVMVLFFGVIPGLFLYRAFTNPEGKIAEVLIVVFGLKTFQFTRRSCCCYWARGVEDPFAGIDLDPATRYREDDDLDPHQRAKRQREAAAAHRRRVAPVRREKPRGLNIFGRRA